MEQKKEQSEKKYILRDSPRLGEDTKRKGQDPESHYLYDSLHFESGTKAPFLRFERASRELRKKLREL